MSERVEAWAKVAGALAASGVFLYIVGVGVVWQRLRNAGLPEEEGLSVIPKDQVAVAGVSELLISLGMAALLVGLPLLLLKVAKRRVDDPGTSSTPVEQGFVRWPGLWLGVGLVVAALLVPWSWPGVISVVVVGIALAVGLRFFVSTEAAGEARCRISGWSAPSRLRS